MSKVDVGEYNKFYQPYIQQIKNNDKDVVENLSQSLQIADALFNSIDKEKYEYRYAKNKWTIKELIQHIIDAERVFAYRALRIARFDKTELPGFDENDYVKVYDANQRLYANLVEELRMVRKSTVLLFESFDKKSLLNTGITGGSKISVRALGYIISGHLLHHLDVIKNRYL